MKEKKETNQNKTKKRKKQHGKRKKKKTNSSEREKSGGKKEEKETVIKIIVQEIKSNTIAKYTTKKNNCTYHTYVGCRKRGFIDNKLQNKKCEDNCCHC